MQMHMRLTGMEAGVVASYAAANKITKCSDVTRIHLYYPVNIKMAGTWHQVVNLIMGDEQPTSLQCKADQLLFSSSFL